MFGRTGEGGREGGREREGKREERRRRGREIEGEEKRDEKESILTPCPIMHVQEQKNMTKYPFSPAAANELKSNMQSMHCQRLSRIRH